MRKQVPPSDSRQAQPERGPTQPLTGLPLAAGSAAATRPALFVKIENAPQARPQTGLDKADVVYEAIAEGGITRFAAIFQSIDPGDLGPVRSVRPQDPDIAAPLRGIAAFSGGVAPIVSDLSTVAQNLSADTSVAAAAYHRTSDRSAPHNLYATASKLWALAAVSVLLAAPAAFPIRRDHPPARLPPSRSTCRCRASPTCAGHGTARPGDAARTAPRSRSPAPGGSVRQT